MGESSKVTERWDSREERYHELDTPEATMVRQDTVTQGLHKAVQWLRGSSVKDLLSKLVT